MRSSIWFAKILITDVLSIPSLRAISGPDIFFGKGFGTSSEKPLLWTEQLCKNEMNCSLFEPWLCTVAAKALPARRFTVNKIDGLFTPAITRQLDAKLSPDKIRCYAVVK